MLKNYFRTAVRLLLKNKAFSFINIMGLALGLACSLLIMLWVNDEYKVDSFHKNRSQLYTIYEQQFRDGVANAFYGGPGMMAAEMKRVFPEVQYASQFAWNELKTFEANNKILKVEGNHASSDFFKMFSYTLLEGNPETALQSPGDISISRKMAEDFFGSPGKAIGKTIRFENERDFKIMAVFENTNQHSSQQFDYLLSWQQFLEVNEWAKNWTNNGPTTYVQLRPGSDVKAFRAKIEKFLDAYNKEQTPRSYVRLGMASFGDVYLHGNFDSKANVSGGRIQYVKLFSVVAIFILLIACINFMNLTTAYSVKRAREIGVRKAIGAFRFSLIRQFMGEALFIVGISIAIALTLVTIAIPSFNQLTGKEIEIPFNSFNFWLIMAALLVVTGLISGSYPALYLSAFQPVKVLKGLPKFSNSALWFRKGLVVFQFVLSIILIISTVVVSKQVKFIQKMNLGYDRENLVYIPEEGDLTAKFDVLKNLALKTPGIKDVSRIGDNPTEINNGTGGVVWEGKDPNADIDFAHTAVGYDFIKTMHLQLVAGRDFSREFPTDSVGFILNESALKIIGFKDPIGKPITFWGNKGTIIGVLKDFHFNSLHEPIRPMVLRLVGNQWGASYILARINAGQTKEGLAGLEKLCKELNPKFPFTYKFSDEEYAKLYRSEQMVDQFANYFAVLAIFISCLGLLGLVTFTAEQRTKEFGIRKVLGASPVAVFKLLSKEFLVLVTIAILVASPVAWFFMQNWLLDYAYKIDMSWWMFVVAGIAALLIALITVSFQSVRAALANPITSLRSE